MTPPDPVLSLNWKKISTPHVEAICNYFSPPKIRDVIYLTFEIKLTRRSIMTTQFQQPAVYIPPAIPQQGYQVYE